jgi:tagatose-1,6-bisphosphate aldolase non-catalytic subunit AgaZ/GatZ
MNKNLRKKAVQANTSLLEYILQKIEMLKKETGVNRTIFAACPNSISVIKASLRSAKRANAPIKFAATLNQVDLDRGYTNMNQQEFVQTIKEQARLINFTGPVIVAVDHGGPWLKDIQKTEDWPLEKAMDWVKKSFEASVAAGFDLIHVDPTVDATLKNGEIISIDVVVERTIELISHTEKYRRDNGYDRIAYEVGTEEVHGGLADLVTFNRFLTGLKVGLRKLGLEDVWPCFVVGKVGTDLHTTLFDPVVAKQLTEAAAPFGSVIKGHYSDGVENPEDYPKSGMGAANIGPEFTEGEYNGLMELLDIERKLFTDKLIAKTSGIKTKLWDAVINSNRWQKWLSNDENKKDFYANSKQRQEWLIKTGCRYIWENPEVLVARNILYENISNSGIDAEGILLSNIEKAMDKYFFNFNLIDLNEAL